MAATDLIHHSLKRFAEMSWRRGLIIGGVLLFSGYLGFSSSPSRLLMLLAACGAAILVSKPEFGPVVLLVSAISIPFALGTGTETPFNIVALLIPLLVAIWLTDMLRRRSVKLVRSKVNVLLVAFVLSALVSFAAGSLPWNPFAKLSSLAAQAGGLAIFVFSVAAFFLVGNLIKHPRWLRLLTGVFLAIGAVVVVGRAVPFVGTLSNSFMTNGAGGSLFWLWVVALAGGQAVFNRSANGLGRLVLGGLALLTLATGLLQSRAWVSGWLPSLIVILALIWLRSARAGLVVTVISIAMVFASNSAISETLYADNAYSLDTRDEAAQILIEQVLPSSPIIGLGFANYHQYTLLYPIRGYYVEFNSHNNYIDILMQTGLVGLAIFAGLMAAIGRLGWNLRKRVGSGFARGYVYGCLGGLAGMLVSGLLGDWFLPFVYNIGLTGFRASVLGWMFLGGLVAIEQMVHQQQLGVTSSSEESASFERDFSRKVESNQ